MRKNRNVGIVGVGQTHHSSHREDVNQPEMVYEAVCEALDQTGLTMKDIGCVLHGNMELFEMVHQPDLWHSLGMGSFGKETLRLTTGGTTGTTVFCAADNMVASGLHDVVLAIGFEKLQEGHTTGGITNMADPLWARQLQTGALTGKTAQAMIDEFGAERAKKVAMLYRIIMDQNAMKNDKAHRRFNLQFDQADELAENSPALMGELRMIHMCSQSDGACAMILASEDRAKEICKQPAWVKDHITVHREETFNIFGEKESTNTFRYAAERLYKRNHIEKPQEEIDVFEMYDPSAWWGADWLRDFLLFDDDEHLKMIERGDIAIDGSFPVNPSGGVIATNPIGATAMIRVGEAAMQVMGTAGDHQIPGTVNQAMASGFGGTLWTVLILLTREVPW